MSDIEPIRSAEDARFMALALALGRRGLGRTWPNPAVGAVVVKDGVIVGRGWTQPGGRPHAETEALAPRRRGGPRGDALRDAGTVLPSRQDAALRRRHHRERRHPRGLRAGRSQSGGRGRRPLAHGARPASWSRSGSAPRRRGGRMPAISGACRTAARTSCSSSRSPPTRRSAWRAAGRQRSPARRARNARASHARDERRACSPASAPRWRTIRCSPAACRACPRRCGSCSTARCGCRLAAGWSASARQMPLWVVTAEGAPRERADGTRGAWRRGAARDAGEGRLDLGGGAEAVGRTRDHPAHGRGRADPRRRPSSAPIWSTKPRSSVPRRSSAPMGSMPSTDCRFPH